MMDHVPLALAIPSIVAAWSAVVVLAVRDRSRR